MCVVLFMFIVYQAAEDANEAVYILGHIPAGTTDCLMTWGSKYFDIINRYENTIIAQFMGHTHKDHVCSSLLMYDVILLTDAVPNLL